MNWITAFNAKPLSLEDIPLIPLPRLRDELIESFHRHHYRVVGFFGQQRHKDVIVYLILADDDHSRLLITSSFVENGQSYSAIASDIPAFHLFERELHEDFGVIPAGHPWLKPVRYSVDRYDPTRTISNYPFFTMTGEEIHEVAVGPVHAGVIEPGHFRFMCEGEKIHHLEIQLGYQHRGVEKLLTAGDILNKTTLVESIAGDTVIGHTLAFANAVEALAGFKISSSAAAIRGIALELERIGVHLGDLSAIANDIAYLSGQAIFGAMRTTIINTSMALCGSRFGRGLIQPGGVQFNIHLQLKEKIQTTLKKISVDVSYIAEAMFASPGVLSRLEQTGVVRAATAREIGLVGMAARASGIRVDVRCDHPFGIYKNFPIHTRVLESGDVFARAYIRYLEIQQSINYIFDLLERFPSRSTIHRPVPALMPNSLVIVMVEGWRGEIDNILITDSQGQVSRYKVKDPSFNN